MRTLNLGIVGDYKTDFRPHTATQGGIIHAADHLGCETEIVWLPTDTLVDNFEMMLHLFDGLWCAPGSPYRSMDGALNAIRFARENDWPFIGTCGGFQHVVIEYARNVLQFKDATHAEYDPYASTLFVSALSCSLVGQTMQVRLREKSRAATLYQTPTTEEEYYCNFGLNPAYQPLFEQGELRIAGTDQDGEVRILEVPGHRFFVATLFVPQLTSTPERPHPLIVAWLRAASEFSVSRIGQSPTRVDSIR